MAAARTTTCVCTFEHNLIFQLLDIVTGSLVAAVGVQEYMQGGCYGFPCNAGFWFGFFLLCVGAGVALLALCLPLCVIRYLRFVVTFFGRGLLYLALGLFVYGPPDQYAYNLVPFVAALFCWLVGVTYIILVSEREREREREREQRSLDTGLMSVGRGVLSPPWPRPPNVSHHHHHHHLLLVSPCVFFPPQTSTTLQPAGSDQRLRQPPAVLHPRRQPGRPVLHPHIKNHDLHKLLMI